MNRNESAHLMPLINGFPRPDWEFLYNEADTLPEETLNDYFLAFMRAWAGELARCAGPEYSASETDSFFIVSFLPERESHLLATFVERARDKIVNTLGGIALDEQGGKQVVIVFSGADLYYRYVSHYYSDDGDFPMSSGMFVSGGNGQIVIPHLSLEETESTFAHEFTHCCVRHLPLPVWLNEGLAVTLEHELCGSQPLLMTKNRMKEHKAFWNTATIQEFWSGESFNRTDNGVSLSYELGRFCVTALAHDFDEFVEFANEASYTDGGQAASEKIYEGSLGGLPFQFLGEGDWCPDPNNWWPEQASPPKS